ncbi:MAG: Nramp family divalent metal transporter [Bacteroidales bacterium]|nr:Nramp family divalent metal transporter [Bacteroidales bacterium]
MENKKLSNSLEEVNASIDTTTKQGIFRKLLAFMGPAYLISVGYMDPGNWATDIAGGSQFGYQLIWVLLMSNLMAVLLQSLSVRLGIVRGRDLAQACRETYPKPVNFILYILAEIAIIATDLAEVVGMAIGLQLLFHIPMLWGILLTFSDTIILLFLMKKGMRKMEAFILALVGIIGLAFFTEMFFAHPVISDIAKGFIPTLPNNTALYIAIGIIGATVMPHNLYLHSSLVQTRKFKRTRIKVGEALRFNFFDSAVALNLAFFVNAAILILAAATFYKAGMFNVSEIQDAYKFLEPLLGSQLAAILFAVALIAAGQSSTLTGTLAGQIVMEGFINFRIQPWARRLITRALAILPAVFVLVYFGESYTGKLLVLSQVVLSLQLGFAVIPLVHFVSDKKSMGKFAIKAVMKFLSWLVATIIVVLNVKLVFEELQDWISSASHPWIIEILVVPIVIALIIVLFYLTVIPLIKQAKSKEAGYIHPEIATAKEFSKPLYQRILVALDFSKTDDGVVQHALSLAQKDSEYLFVHIVESAAALVFGDETDDFESVSDEQRLENFAESMSKKGFRIQSQVGYGNPKTLIPKMAKEFDAQLLVMGAHGHGWFKDLVFGTTIESVRHKVQIPVLIVRNN